MNIAKKHKSKKNCKPKLDQGQTLKKTNKGKRRKAVIQ